MIQKERIKHLNDSLFQQKKYIIYWMQQSQRAEDNHALEFAISQSNKYKKPLIVVFGLTYDFPEANLRHYHFLVQGLKDIEKTLRQRGIRFVLQQTSPVKALISLSKNAAMIIVDRGYLKIQKQWRTQVANAVKCPLIQVETDVIVPIEIVSQQEEYAAFTFRPKIQRYLNDYLKEIKKEDYKHKYVDEDLQSVKLNQISIKEIDLSVQPVDLYIGGTTSAKKHLQIFLNDKIEHYDEKHNDPTVNYISNLSPYLHFGQISPLYIALNVLKKHKKGNDSFLEELIVRRELSMNFVHYNPSYDTYDGIPNWAKKSLKKHQDDKRMYSYSTQELEHAETHDPYWNAAQKQMVKEGKMHGYMRMYWGKKIIEWTENPRDAFTIGIYLNNKYEIDGRDANGYTGIAWCFGKHDRPWAKREIFGNIRYMNANGLKRKFDSESYARKYNE